MTTPAETVPTDLVNEILECERQARGGITWVQLAKELGFHPVTIWKWRHGGDLGVTANALLPLAAKHGCTLKRAE